MVFVLTFRRAPADGDAPPAESEEGGAGGAKAGHPADVTVMTVQVGSKDTVDTLNRRIRVRTNALP
jgi:hypothetical protein